MYIALAVLFLLWISAEGNLVYDTSFGALLERCFWPILIVDYTVGKNFRKFVLLAVLLLTNFGGLYKIT